MEYSLTHCVQFSETDLAGVVHFSNYFRMMEEVEQAFFRSLGISVVLEHAGRHFGFPRIAAKCEYLAPVHFDEEVKLHLRVVKIGRSSFTFDVNFSVKDRAVATGQITTVCCEMKESAFQAVPIPDFIRQRLQ